MDALKQWEQRLRRLTVEEQEKAILKIVDEYEPVAVDLNTSQLLEGKDSKGEMLAPYRNKEYAAFKATLNSRRVRDLKLTGDFHDSIFQDSSKFPVEHWATDEKTVFLVAGYGADILGIPEDKKDEFTEQLKPEIQAYYRSVLSIR